MPGQTHGTTYNTNVFEGAPAVFQVNSGKETYF